MRQFQTDYYEEGILNALLTWPEDHPKIFNQLLPDHFEPGLRQKLYTGLFRLYKENKENPLSNIAMISGVCATLKEEKINWKFWIKKIQEEALALKKASYQPIQQNR